MSLWLHSCSGMEHVLLASWAHMKLALSPLVLAHTLHRMYYETQIPDWLQWITKAAKSQKEPRAPCQEIKASKQQEFLEAGQIYGNAGEDRFLISISLPGTLAGFFPPQLPLYVLKKNGPILSPDPEETGIWGYMWYDCVFARTGTWGRNATIKRGRMAFL